MERAKNAQGASGAKTKTSTSKDSLAALGLLPPVMACKPVNPTEGLTLGGRPITLDELMVLDPDELEEHTIMQNGNPVSLGQLAELLAIPDDFVSMVLDGFPEDEEEEQGGKEG